MANLPGMRCKEQTGGREQLLGREMSRRPSLEGHHRQNAVFSCLHIYTAFSTSLWINLKDSIFNNVYFNSVWFILKV